MTATLSLADLRPSAVTVEVVLPDESVRVCNLRLLTYAQWNAVVRSVADPVVPLDVYVEDGKKKVTKLVDDPDYQRAQAEAEDERKCRLIGLALAAQFPEFGVMDDETRGEMVRGFDSALVGALWNALMQLRFRAGAKIQKADVAAGAGEDAASGEPD